LYSTFWGKKIRIRKNEKGIPMEYFCTDSELTGVKQRKRSMTLQDDAYERKTTDTHYAAPFQKMYHDSASLHISSKKTTTRITG
jgi:hypothetical protein